MKKTFLKFFAAVLMVGFAAVSVGCKDYDDDIDSLNSAVAGLQTTVAGLQSQIANGKTISSVSQAADGGVTITFTDNTSVTIPAGKDGGSGSSSVWSIGDDGFWYENGKATEYKAVGTDGADGVYYVPVTDKKSENYGTWQVYQSGKPVEPAEFTTEKWLGEGVLTAMLDGNTLTFYGVEGAEEGEGVEINLGADLGNLALIPNVHHIDTGAEILSFYNLLDYLKPNTAGEYQQTFVNQTKKQGVAWSYATVQYRLSPADVYLPNGNFTGAGFIGRIVETRAVAGEIANPLTNVTTKVEQTKTDAVVTVKATVNESALYDKDKNVLGADETNAYDALTPAKVGADNQYLLARLNAQVGSKQYAVSDELVTVAWAPITKPLLAVTTKDGDWKADGVPAYTWAVSTTTITTASKNRGLYERTKTVESNRTGEDSDFVQQFVEASAEHHLTIGVGQTIDLAEVVALFAVKDTNFHMEKDLGFEVEYEYTKPAVYNGVGTEKTNDNSFITLSGSKVTADNRTSAIGRMPVVRVDAYVGGKLVATGYVKIQITGSAAGDITVSLKDVEVNYGDLTADGTQVSGELNWDKVNREIYDVLKMTHKQFLDAYTTDGEFKKTVTVKTTYVDDDMWANNFKYNPTVYTWTDAQAENTSKKIYALNSTAWSTKRIIPEVGEDPDSNKTAAQVVNLDSDSAMINVKENTNSTDEKTSSALVEIEFTNLAYTQHTFEDVNGKGAKYDIEIVLTPNDELAAKVVITLSVYVKENYGPYKFVNNYYTKYEGEDAIHVFGMKDATTNKWVMKATAQSAFAQVGYNTNVTLTNAEKAWKGNIFELVDKQEKTYNLVDVHFYWAPSADVDADDYWKAVTEKSAPTLADKVKAGYVGPTILAVSDDEITKDNYDTEFVGLDLTTAKMEEAQVPKRMWYHQLFENGENGAYGAGDLANGAYDFEYTYWIIFDHPFEAGDVPQNLTIEARNGNHLDMSQYVYVRERNKGRDVYKYYAEEKDKDGAVTKVAGLWFSDAIGGNVDVEKAGNIYGLKNTDQTAAPAMATDIVSVEYSIDPDDETTKGISIDEDGVLFVNNEADAIAKDFKATVIAKVTLLDGYVVYVEIPVTVKTVLK